MGDKTPIAEVLRTLSTEGQAILDCAGRIEAGGEAAAGILSAVDLLKSALDRGGKIVVTGVGKSGKIAQKIAATLSSTGNLAVFLHPTEGLHGDLGVVTKSDVVLALSYTGNTEELIRLAPSLKALGVPVIGLGGNAKSKLAEFCAAWIDASVAQEACPHNLAPTSSTTLALALGDALAVALMRMRGFDARSFAQNHPGGSLGRRLTLTVSDLMHSGDRVACVAPAASMDEVVVKGTEKKLGCVLVTEGSKLLGLVTDGDIRRALGHREKFFSLKASDVMTRSPAVARPEMMAAEALELMENRPSQISVLPVVGRNNEWLGVIRLHDLARTL